MAGISTMVRINMPAGIKRICLQRKALTPFDRRSGDIFKRQDAASTIESGNPMKGGFTLIELVISLAVLAFTLLGVGNILMSSARSSIMANKTTLACNLCQAKIEGLKSLSYNSLSDSQENNIDEEGNSGGCFNRTVTATAGPIPNTKLITVTTVWTDLSGTRTVSLRTMFANL